MTSGHSRVLGAASLEAAADPPAADPLDRITRRLKKRDDLSDQDRVVLAGELNALLVASTAPGTEGARAKRCLELLDDGRLDGLIDSHRCSSRRIAVEVVLASGFPEALNLSPDDLAFARERTRVEGRGGLLLQGALLMSLAGLLELLTLPTLSLVNPFTRVLGSLFAVAKLGWGVRAIVLRELRRADRARRDLAYWLLIYSGLTVAVGVFEPRGSPWLVLGLAVSALSFFTLLQKDPDATMPWEKPLPIDRSP